MALVPMRCWVTPVPFGPAEVRAALEALEEIAEHAESSALSDRSRELHAADWRRFTTWCARMQLNPLPAEVQTVRLYLADMASLMHPDGTPVYKVASIERHLAAIAHHHHAVGAASPVRFQIKAVDWAGNESAVTEYEFNVNADEVHRSVVSSISVTLPRAGTRCFSTAHRYFSKVAGAMSRFSTTPSQWRSQAPTVSLSSRTDPICARSRSLAILSISSSWVGATR